MFHHSYWQLLNILVFKLHKYVYAFSLLIFIPHCLALQQIGCKIGVFDPGENQEHSSHHSIIIMETTSIILQNKQDC